MESTRKQLLLVKSRTEKFNWGSSNNGNYNSSIILYDSQDEKFKFDLPETSTEETYMSDISSSIQLIFSKAENSIELLSTFNQQNHSTSIFLRVIIQDSVLKSLGSLLMDPVITVEARIDDKSSFQAVISLDKLKAGKELDTEIQTFSRWQSSGFCLTFTTFTYSIGFEWYTPPTKKNGCNILQKLWTDKTLADCCILTGDNTEIRCHGSVLAANSDVFNAMLTSGLQESKTKRIEMADLSEKVVNALLSYMYGQEIKIFQMEYDMAFDLLRTAHKYNLVSLQWDLVDTFLKKPDNSYEMNAVLGLYYFTVNIEELDALCDKAVNILKRQVQPQTIM
ncbi:TD and POZ domain-containing protein 1-like [Orchesella cincta]|uniref:TD and POZ domain-containing protein 1-like n=1 Tax=Orchesella cincta TaxID=48709 RepID=A0A1D2M3M2_ORCCI|nr:TD and POZ domain-containing protein 1-like [Orchesella cincta]